MSAWKHELLMRMPENRDRLDVDSLWHTLTWCKTVSSRVLTCTATCALSYRGGHTEVVLIMLRYGTLECVTWGVCPPSPQREATKALCATVVRTSQGQIQGSVCGGSSKRFTAASPAAAVQCCRSTQKTRYRSVSQPAALKRLLGCLLRKTLRTSK